MGKKRVPLFHVLVVILLLFLLINISGYGDAEAKEAATPKTPSVEQLLLGSWTRYNNKIYTLLIIRANGNWTSDLRIEGASSKIVERKGACSGTWHLEEKNITMTVLTSEIEDVWPKGTFTLEIVEINDKSITLKYPNSRVITWKKARIEKATKEEGAAVSTINPVIAMKPIVVNLNKISSNEKDRYLCLALELHLEEMDSTAIVPKLHPRAWDSTILFLSSLLYNDVKTFDEMKVVTDKLTKILNPYFYGLITEVSSTHVMVSSSMEKVDEFIIEHSPPPPVIETPEGETKEDKKAADNKGKEKKAGDKDKEASNKK